MRGGKRTGNIHTNSVKPYKTLASGVVMTEINEEEEQKGTFPLTFPVNTSPLNYSV